MARGGGGGLSFGRYEDGNRRAPPAPPPDQPLVFDADDVVMPAFAVRGCSILQGLGKLLLRLARGRPGGGG